jgi:hypothetical protein
MRGPVFNSRAHKKWKRERKKERKKGGKEEIKEGRKEGRKGKFGSIFWEN